MPRILQRHLLPLKDMSQMRATGIARNLGPQAIRIHCPFHHTRNFLIKAWPATAGMKLRIRGIQWRVTPAAQVRAFDEKIIVFSSKRHFRAFIHNDAFFFGSKWVEIHREKLEPNEYTIPEIK